MEVTVKPTLKERLSSLFLKEKMHFLSRCEINWKSVRNCAIGGVVIGVLFVLILPAPAPITGDFHENAEPGSTAPQSRPESDPSQDALNQLGGMGRSRSVPASLDNLYASSGGGSPPSGDDRSSSMILARGGMDSKTQVPPGSRLAVRLYEKAIVATQGMPVIGIVVPPRLTLFTFPLREWWVNLSIPATRKTPPTPSPIR